MIPSWDMNASNISYLCEPTNLAKMDLKQVSTEKFKKKCLIQVGMHERCDPFQFEK